MFPVTPPSPVTGKPPPKVGPLAHPESGVHAGVEPSPVPFSVGVFVLLSDLGVVVSCAWHRIWSSRRGYI